MQRAKKFFKMAFTPITVMMIPHSNKKPFNCKIPSIGIILLFLAWIAGTTYAISTAVSSAEYKKMQKNLSFYTDQFAKIETTITALKKSERQFRDLFALGSREEILDKLDTSDSGSIDMEALKGQINLSLERVGEIRDYLRQKRDIYMATPKGYPVKGEISSTYGQRVHPTHKGSDFHSGIDLSAPPGTNIRATADGIVSFAGWSGGSGLLVVIEHGFDLSTYYAHAKKIVVKVGETVKRGQVIGHVGSTGTSTGPHVHYEIWLKGKPVNPKNYYEGRA